MKEFNIPKYEFVQFDNADIITTSDDCNYGDICGNFTPCLSFTPTPTSTPIQ